MTTPQPPIPSPVLSASFGRLDAPRPQLSIVLPAYNESEGISTVVKELLWPTLQKIFPSVSGLFEPSAAFEVLIVDDGSKDETFVRVQALAAEIPWVRGLRFSRNFGKEAAIYAGLEAARGEAVLVMDSDGQHPPEVIEQMWAIWKTGQFDIISGVKQDRSVDSLLGRTASGLFYGVMRRLTRIDLHGHSDFKLIRDTVVREYLEQPERMRFFRALVPWLGFRQANVPFVVAERVAGTSRWSMLGLARLALTAITSFTGAPLYWSAYLGAFGLFASFLLTLQALYSWLTGIAVPGWTSLTFLLLFFGSTILLSLGLIGVYLHQIFEEVKRRKPFIVAETTPALSSSPPPPPSPNAP
ncbi:glycosyltransferase family 2 protein [Myxococcota bacterium]|nr:glycosyltransferase family 2 protein [Myxococcota bacterium]